MEITAPIATAVVLEIRGNTVIDGRTFKGTIHANHTLVKSSGKWLFLACYFGTE